jgi:hypothetical protein
MFKQFFGYETQDRSREPGEKRGAGQGVGGSRDGDVCIVLLRLTEKAGNGLNQKCHSPSQKSNTEPPKF